MSNWIECDNVEALKRKMEGCEVEVYREETCATVDYWLTVNTYDFPPDNYRYKEKAKFKGDETVLSWHQKGCFEVGMYRYIDLDDKTKIIPYQSEVVEAECATFYQDFDSMLKTGERGRFLIMRIPDEN